MDKIFFNSSIVEKSAQNQLQTQNEAKKDSANDPNDPNDTLHISHSLSAEPSESNSNASSSNPTEDCYFRCYYYDEYKSNDERDYTIHVVNVHHEMAFPSKADIEKLGLKPQGKEWET